MNGPYYIYLLHEVPVEPPYYCKIGYSCDPVRRLGEIQAGNPRPLRSPDYPERPSGVFGFPVPAENHARALEERLFERFTVEGLTIHGDVDYVRLRASRREWVAGIHPEELWKMIAREWSEYVHAHGLLEGE